MKIDKQKICLMILTGIYIFFVSIFNVKAQTYQLVPNNFYCPNGWSSSDLIIEDKHWYGCNATYGGYNKSVNYYNFSNNGFYDITGYLYIDYGSQINFSINGTSCFITTFETNNNTPRIQYYCFNVEIKDNTLTSEINIYFPDTGRKMYVDRDITISTHFDKSNSNNINDIKDKMNEDISNGDKEAPDQTQYNNAKQQEDNIIQSISNVSPNDITFSQDLQATNKIWETTTRFLQTNAKVMGLVISILSIGIIKLIMNR